MIKLVTIDLDNTLFNKDKVITDYNKEIIAKARDNGVYIVIASGRPINGVKRVLNELNMTTANDYAICYNGGNIYNVGKNEIISKERLTGKDVKYVYELSLKMGFFFHAFRDDGILICPKYNHYTDIEVTLNNLDYKIIDVNTIDDNDLFIKAMIVDSENNIDFAFNNVPDEYRNYFNVVRSSKIFLEFLPKNIDKGNALKFLANYLNIDIKDTMAIGDASNDLGMIIEAGIGVAMANAFPEVKEHASYITDDCENSGVAKAIEKYCL